MSKKPQQPVLDLDKIFSKSTEPYKRDKRGRDDDDEPVEVEPLRKRLVDKQTGLESNFMTAYGNVMRMPDMAPEQVNYLRRYYDIEVEGTDCPRPIVDFNEAGLDSDISQRLRQLGYEYPTPIQMQALPCMMAGRDIVGTAETGSGKTLCYILPMLMFLKTKPFTKPGEGPLALILAPTRELVEQIYSEICKFVPQFGAPGHGASNSLLPIPNDPSVVEEELPPVQYTYTGDYSQYQEAQYDYSQYDGLAAAQTFSFDQSSTGGLFMGGDSASQYSYRGRKVLGCVGGIPISANIPPLQRGVDILVSTPGRLIDLAHRGAVKFDRISYLVFDEADRMLFAEMEAQVRAIVSLANVCVRQTVLFSATMPPSVERLVRSSVLNPIYVRVGSVDTPAETIQQDIIFVQSREKKYKLLEVLRKTERPPVLIFCNSTLTVDYLVKFLRDEQFHAAGIHGEKSQTFRFRAMSAFKEGRLDILVASDLVSRGIDVQDVNHVILFDLPDSIEDYIHRIGRTGRAGKSGRATGFLTIECKIAPELRKLLRAGKHNVPMELNYLKQFGMQVVRNELGKDVPIGKRD